MVRHTGFEPVATRLKVCALPTELMTHLWSGKRGSNSRHSAWKADALPTELFPHILFNFWWRGKDLNLRPSGYEPDELPDCSTPRYKWCLEPESNRHGN